MLLVGRGRGRELGGWVEGEARLQDVCGVKGGQEGVWMGSAARRLWFGGCRFSKV